MNIKRYLSEKNNLFAENRLLKFVILVIGFVTLVNTVLLARSINSHRTIILPPVVNTKLEVSGDKLSDEYLKLMVRYITSLGLNYTPSNVRGQFDELLTLYSPETYPEAKTTFYRLAENVESAKVTTSFQLQKITIDTAKKEVEIQGIKSQSMNEQKIKETHETYGMDYTVADGRFMIKKLYPKRAEKEDTK